MLVNLPVLPGDCAVQKIAGIKLHSGLIGPHLHYAPGRRLINFGSLSQLASAAVQHPIVVVAFATTQLLIVVVDASADRSGFAKVERSAVHSGEFSGGNKDI